MGLPAKLYRRARVTLPLHIALAETIRATEDNLEKNQSLVGMPERCAARIRDLFCCRRFSRRIAQNSHKKSRDDAAQPLTLKCEALTRTRGPKKQSLLSTSTLPASRDMVRAAHFSEQGSHPITAATKDFD